MRILITGGTGFIGKHLLNKLENTKYKILVCSRKLYKNKSNIKYTKQDIGNKLNRTIINFKPEILIHLAWQGIPDFSLENSVENIKKNIFFLNNISCLPKLKKIIVSGSCLEYGSHNGLCRENLTYKSNSFFSYSKNIIREFLQMICLEKKIDYVWLRFFYVYGLNQRKYTIISTIIDNLLKKKNIKIKNPTAKNDYVYIDDVIDALIKSINIRRINSIINIGSGKTTSIYDLIRKLENFLSKDNKLSRKILKNRKIKKSPSKKSYNYKSKKLINWFPKYNIDRGLKKILKIKKLI